MKAADISKIKLLHSQGVSELESKYPPAEPGDTYWNWSKAGFHILFASRSRCRECSIVHMDLVAVFVGVILEENVAAGSLDVDAAIHI